MKKISIYLAAPLFGIADRHHNLLLAEELEALGYLVILPQREAIKYFDGEKFDLKGIREDCKRQSMKSKVVLANIDGPDADSGTSLEAGIAHATAILSRKNRPLVICVRTDFRTNLEQEIGINGMFGLADKIIYMPAFVNSPEEVNKFYEDLAREIDKTIKELMIKII